MVEEATQRAIAHKLGNVISRSKIVIDAEGVRIAKKKNEKQTGMAYY